ncbi:MAG TPA: tripartite tricarboxylate transporter substrate binding protein [Burkholderiaceae bacterium]|nr:tripartite tricarboxylate transporter substrate binding protein [Burkholderiaceae bacterium]
MMRNRPVSKRRALSLALTATILCAGVPAAAQQHQPSDWPNRTIRLIVPLAAGSTADIVSRRVAEALSPRLGQPVIVDNKTGAGGTIAMSELARAPADGYTIGFASQGTQVFNLALYKKPGYDSLKDFAPIALVGGVSNVMIVPPESKATTVQDVIDEAKRRPGELNFSSGGSGTSHHLSGVLFGQMTDTKWQHVPYKGAPQGVLAVMSGEVQAGWFNTPTVISQYRAGKLKALGVTSQDRSPLLPELPTLSEAGVPGYEVVTWFGFVAPAGTPPAVVDRLNKEVYAVLAEPAVRSHLEEQGFELAKPSPASTMTELVKADMKKWFPVIESIGARVD